MMCIHVLFDCIGKISGDSGYDTVSTITGVTSAQTDTTTGTYIPHIIIYLWGTYTEQAGHQVNCVLNI